MRSPKPHLEANSPLKGIGVMTHFYVHRLCHLLKIKYFPKHEVSRLTSSRGWEIKCFNRYRIPLSDVTARPNPGFATYEHYFGAVNRRQQTNNSPTDTRNQTLPGSEMGGPGDPGYDLPDAKSGVRNGTNLDPEWTNLERVKHVNKNVHLGTTMVTFTNTCKHSSARGV